MTRLGFAAGVCAVLGVVASVPAHAQPACIGDCDGNLVVTINEIITCVNIDLGSALLASCPACSANGISVGITDLVMAVNNALNSCPGGPTPLPTNTSTASPTPTASPTVTPTTASVVRVFTIDSLVGMLVNSDTAGSGLFNDNLLGGGNVAATMSSGPLTLVLGQPDANGVAPLTLQDDVVISIDISLNSSCACMKFLAAQSTGSIDCDGGTAYDTTVSQDTNSVNETAWTIQTNQGSPAGPGNGDLILTGLFQDFPGGCGTVVDCATANYTNATNQFPFTTTKSTAVKKVLNHPYTTTAGGGGMSAPFSCANFATPGSGGTFVSGITFTDPVGGPTADALRFAE